MTTSTKATTGPDGGQPYAATLECDHCGGHAITSSDGMFDDGDGGKCAECGFPGHVSADGESAYWMMGEEADDRCDRKDCEECDAR
jgi:hypothetical protein